MKKLIIIVFVLSLVVMCFSSCKTVNDCPAYGKAEANNIEKRA